MLTLRFLWSWTKITGLAVLAVVIEHAVIPGFWVRVLAMVGTAGLWLLITTGLFREWRAHGAGYRHEISEWPTPRRHRDRP
ncbi:hypothetical protein [Amycolatopsis pithecellobii]|uniref:Uncharacterized protein n=1 Tax=Amycolatopsis pithecellobii TaxID=664692 RepID=A0A6N7YPE3_9PSEU|nr:hypothetical protein [Amycolatopsis pithecellobii]MTD53882.1 hypothetical protein [Amycolatopsis pithecellobii]